MVATGLLFVTYEGSAQRRTRSFSTSDTTKKSRTSERKKGPSVSNTLRTVPQDITPSGAAVGIPRTEEIGIEKTTTEIMQEQAIAPASEPRRKPEREIPGHEDRPQNPDAKPVASIPEQPGGSAPAPATSTVDLPSAPQTVSTNFNAVTGPTENGAFPPDTMGAVGPTQFVLFVNGRIRTFTKSTGVADSVINVDPDVFFASVMTPVSPPVVVNFTSDPNVRYDRLSGRWFLSIIDVPCTAANCSTTAANRWMVAVSDAASAGVISGSTVWTLYQFQTDAANFCDYPSLGVDSQALYTGCNMFTAAGAFVGTNGYVIRKTSILSGGPLVQTTFANLAVGILAGPFAPRGVDNYDPASNEGYFIGVDNATFSTLMIRRVSTPGATPTISANIPLTVATTSSSIPIQHLGNTGGNNGRLDTLDDRLYAAHIRKGRLWTSHNIRVDAAGVASTAAASREAVRWYELNGIRSTDNGGVPIVIQSGTVFDNAATLALSRQYSIPSVMVSGQGHAALGYTTAGSPFRIDAATSGRLVGDTLGTTQAVAFYTASSTAYNPPGDPGGGSGRRWGDYSYTSLDPLDDMTMWTVQEYCNAANTYGAQVAQLVAPPPATPASVTSANANTVPKGRPNYYITLTGTAASGSGFYDPGANLAPPALPFNHIAVLVNGAGAPTVNSVVVVNPTTLTVGLNSVLATVGSYTVKVTNPDGQNLTSATAIVVVSAPTAAPATVSGSVVAPDGTPLSGVTMDLGGNQAATTITDSKGEYRFLNVDTDNFYTVTPALANYRFNPSSRSFSLLGNLTNAVFTGTMDSMSVRLNAIDGSEYFVRQQYLDFLGREPDQSGFNFWTNQIAQCNGNADCMLERRVNISAAFFISIEFQETGGLVDGLYRTSFDRAPQYAEFNPDTATIARDVVVARAGWEQQLASNRQAFLDAFTQRPAFQSIYGGLNNSQYVDQLLVHTRIIWTQGERDALVDGLASGTLTRAGVLGQIAGDQRFIATKRNEMFVMMEYFGYLHRDPDASGYRFWLNKLNQFGGDYQKAEMVKAFIVSGEYRRRFGL